MIAITMIKTLETVCIKVHNAYLEVNRNGKNYAFRWKPGYV